MTEQAPPPSQGDGNGPSVSDPEGEFFAELDTLVGVQVSKDAPAGSAGRSAPLSKLKVISLNDNGILTEVKGVISKRQKLFVWLREQKADIILLQETHFPEDLKRQALIAKQWGGTIIFTPGVTTSSCGTAILLRPGSDVELHPHSAPYTPMHGPHDGPLRGRVTLCHLLWHGQCYTVGSVYAPTMPDQRPRFFKSLKGVLLSYFPRGADGRVEQPAALCPLLLGGRLELH